MGGLLFSLGTAADAGPIADLARRVAERLTGDFGPGHWSTSASEAAVARAMDQARYVVGRIGGEVVASLRLATKKPWAIDVTRFTAVDRALYLVDMAVTPERQRRGIGRRLLAEATRVARSGPADAIRLDAYDAPAGAGPFYLKCGWQPRGSVVYRGTPLLYFELLLDGED
jgi:GNAT superfamily N-acetyltransferase